VGAFFLGRAYWQKGMYEEALRSWETVETGVTGWFKWCLARYDAVTGQREKALEVIEDMEAGWAQGDFELFILWNIALFYADLGDKDEALDWLERAYDERLGFLIYLKVDPGFYPLHEEPRFQALLEKLGLDR